VLGPGISGVAVGSTPWLASRPAGRQSSVSPSTGVSVVHLAAGVLLLSALTVGRLIRWLRRCLRRPPSASARSIALPGLGRLYASGMGGHIPIHPDGVTTQTPRRSDRRRYSLTVEFVRDPAETTPTCSPASFTLSAAVPWSGRGDIGPDPGCRSQTGNIRVVLEPDDVDGTHGGPRDEIADSQASGACPRHLRYRLRGDRQRGNVRQCYPGQSVGRRVSRPVPESPGQDLGQRRWPARRTSDRQSLASNVW